ncbi:hypothetical protein BDV37DRAFT_247637 [Aspergillus pseudonomiae]|uniref:Uncharacterized protein n=1 Tax=Aspergillus pseudonomiae TaxID=1506151 RepID=A0A5N7DDH7_9EURO|nr:uncharacterized protein BDV37DRAFT_247637 [Aspergillus pseudonomiae]KAE8404304.1 hypothetical protein BDV37DRAFT_247637 [Aspergillus pseudonomiae]
MLSDLNTVKASMRETREWLAQNQEPMIFNPGATRVAEVQGFASNSRRSAYCFCVFCLVICSVQLSMQHKVSRTTQINTSKQNQERSTGDEEQFKRVDRARHMSSVN